MKRVRLYLSTCPCFQTLPGCLRHQTLIYINICLKVYIHFVVLCSTNVWMEKSTVVLIQFLSFLHVLVSPCKSQASNGLPLQSQQHSGSFTWGQCGQHDSLLRWRMTWLTDRLPLLCPLSLGTEWVDIAAVKTSVFQNELHLMTSSVILNAPLCFPDQLSDDAVQQSVCSLKCIKWWESKDGFWGRSRHTWTGISSLSCFTKSLCQVTSVYQLANLHQ